MATDRRILRIDIEAEAQTRITNAVTTGAIVAAEGNLLWCRDTLTLYYIGTAVNGVYPLTPVSDAEAAELAREAAATGNLLRQQSARAGTANVEAGRAGSNMLTRFGRRFVQAWAGRTTGRVPLGIDEDGMVLMDKLAVARNVQQAAPEGSGILWGIAGRSGGRLAIWVDRQGTVHIPNLDGNGESTVTSYPVQYVALGDSISEGLGDDNFNHAPGRGYPAYLASSLGLPVINRGISSQTSREIAARHGAPGTLAVFTADSSGNVTLSDPATGPLLSLVSRTQAGRLGDVRGTLARTVASGSNALDPRGDRYAFTPLSGEAALRTGVDLLWVPDNPYLDSPHLVMVGRNDPTSSTLLDRQRAIIASLTDRARQASVLLGVTLAQSETSGNGTRTAIIAANTAAGQAFPQLFYDPNRILCRNADGSVRDTPNPAWMADDLHPNAKGYKLLAAALKLFIQSRRYPTVSEFTGFVGAAA